MALDFVHAHNIIHRDIKTSNLLIGEDLSIQICDFGLARALPRQHTFEKELCEFRKTAYKSVTNPKKSTDRKSNLQRFKAQMSKALEKKTLKLLDKKRSMTATAQSRWYRAPEVIVCDVNYNQSIDIWSLGCIISELIKCTKPY